MMPKRRSVRRPLYIMATAVILVVLMIAMAIYELRRSRGDLIHLMEAAAALLVQSLALSGENAIHAFDWMVDLTAERLLDNARLVDRLDQEGRLSSDELTRIARENYLYRINLFDASGDRILSSHDRTHPDSLRGPLSREVIAPILSGEKEEQIIGFRECLAGTGERFAVAVRRTRGGAIVMNVDAADIRALRREIGVGRLVQDIGEREGIEYIVLQDGEGLIFASRGVIRMPKIEGDPFLMEALSGEDIASRITTVGSRKVFEVVRPFVLDGVSYGVLRVGLSTDHLDEISRRARLHVGLAAVLLVVVGFIVFNFLITHQNYALLDREHDRILVEVHRMEADLQRGKRSSAMGKLAAGVAHEIRNPLNAIGMIVQRLEKEFVPTSGSEEYRSLAQTVRSETQRINGMVQQFLQFARPPKLSPAPTEVDGLVQEMLNLVAAQGVDKGVKGIALAHDLKAPRPVPLDREQMKQALLNLLLNALEATSAGGRITVCTEQSKHQTVVEVRDTGRGIPSEALDRVFDPYFTTKNRGTGLGLAIVHRIIEEHGGRMEVESKEGEGSVFRMVFPAKSRIVDWRRSEIRKGSGA